jgi:hypothetical protein
MMKLYMRNAWVRVGLVLVVVGWLPLAVMTLLVAMGDWPGLNPLVPRLLSMLTVWPAVLCVVVGVFQVKRDLALQARSAQTAAASAQESGKAAPPLGHSQENAGPLPSFLDPHGGRGGVPPLGHSQENAGPPQVCLTPTGGGSASRPWGHSDVEKTVHGRSAQALPQGDSRPWMEHRITRTVAGIVGFGLVFYGTTGMLHAQGRGAAVALAIGVVAVYWAFVGRLPLRFWH